VIFHFISATFSLLTQPSCSNKIPASFQEDDGGSSSHDNLSGQSIPHSAHSNTKEVKSVLTISGGISVVLTSVSFHNLMHLPGPMRPARPARCSALKTDSFLVTSVSIPAERLKLFTRDKPLSITTVIPGTVKDVSAIALERITTRFPL